MNPVPIFTLKDVSYSYHSHLLALEGVSLEVFQGEKLAILGSNGSGKSTLLKIMDGLYFPSSGSVTAFGSPLTEEALRPDEAHFAFRSRVGLIFQDSDAQLFMPTVWDEVAFGPLQLGMLQQEVAGRVESALAALRIEKLCDRAPHQISGGEKKRVALASVLSLAPQVWLLDEPSAGLDPRSVSWLIDFINQPEQTERTIILATHDLELAAATADRVYVLDEDHHLVAGGKTDEIMQNRSLLERANLVR